MTPSSSYFGTNNPLSDIFLGTPAKIKGIDLYTPQQKNMLDTFLQGGSDTVNQVRNFYNSILSGDSKSFEALQKPAIQNWENKIMPAIMNQVGQTAGLRSSALGQQLGESAVDLVTNLEALKAGMQGQAASGLQNLMKFGMTPTKQFIHTPRTQGMIEMMPYYIAMILGGRK